MAERRTEPPAAPLDAEAQVRKFISKFSPEHQTLIGAVREAMHSRLPTAYELAYDNYNFFVLGYGPTDRPSDAILSVATGAGGMNIFFLHGAALPDPKGVLLGSGRQTRFIRLGSAADLDRPEVEDLIAAALAHSPKRMRETGRMELIVRSVSAKQRPRRQGPKKP